MALSPYEQLSGPLGNGLVQFFVVPFTVISTFAVAEPSYVTFSRRSTEADWVPYVTVTFMWRITVPALGYVGPVVADGIGITRPEVVSPAVRVAVKSAVLVLPVVLSEPADMPSTVRCVLPVARPPTV